MKKNTLLCLRKENDVAEMGDNLDFICRSEAYGDFSTNFFDDCLVGKKIKGFIVYYGCIIDGIVVVYGDDCSIRHGTTTVCSEKIMLDEDEYIVQIDGYVDEWKKYPEKAISLITFISNKGKAYGPYGRKRYKNYVYQPIKNENLFSLKSAGKKIVALYGNSSSANNFISRLGVYWKNI